MELLLKDKNGKFVPVEQIGELNAGDIVIRVNTYLHKKAIEDYEKELSKKFGRKVIVLDGRVSEIVVAPLKMMSKILVGDRVPHIQITHRSSTRGGVGKSPI